MSSLARTRPVDQGQCLNRTRREAALSLYVDVHLLMSRDSSPVLGYFYYRDQAL